MIQYWQRYAYNDSFASANHEGDWEFIAVLTIEFTSEPPGPAYQSDNWSWATAE